MVSGFLTPGGKLEVPKSVCDEELERNPMWVKVDGRPVRNSMWLHEYGKTTTEKMVWQTLRIAMPIFQYALPECQALFAFDNVSNHCCFAEDAFIASNISLNPGGRQPRMREEKALTMQEDYPTHLFFLTTIRTSHFAVRPKVQRLF